MKMIINNFKNSYNIKTNPIFCGNVLFSTGNKINNKGLSKDIFQKKEEVIDIDSIEPVKKRETKAKIQPEDSNTLSDKEQMKLIELLEKNINLTLDCDKNLFTNISEREYDISQIMLIAARNSISKKGNSYVYSGDIPQIFKGISQEDIAYKLSEVINKIFWNFPRNKKETGAFKIKDKKFYIQEIGSGFVGRVYKIFDDYGNTAAIKSYSTDMPNNNGLSEIATLRQMTKDKVNNVPKFYMAHASDYSIDNKNKVYNDKCWMLYEYIDKNTPVKKEGISWKKWCKNYGLVHSDSNNKKQYSGKYLVDVGGILHNKNGDFTSYTRCYDFLKKAYREGRNTQGVINIIKEQLL